MRYSLQKVASLFLAQEYARVLVAVLMVYMGLSLQGALNQYAPSSNTEETIAILKKKVYGARKRLLYSLSVTFAHALLELMQEGLYTPEKADEAFETSYSLLVSHFAATLTAPEFFERLCTSDPVKACLETVQITFKGFEYLSRHPFFLIKDPQGPHPVKDVLASAIRDLERQQRQKHLKELSYWFAAEYNSMVGSKTSVTSFALFLYEKIYANQFDLEHHFLDMGIFSAFMNSRNPEAIFLSRDKDLIQRYVFSFANPILTKTQEFYHSCPSFSLNDSSK